VEAIVAPNLIQIEELHLGWTPSLSSLQIPKLAILPTLQIYGPSKLTNISLVNMVDSLERLSVYKTPLLLIEGTEMLTHLSYLNITLNAGLSNLTMSKLETVDGDLKIGYNGPGFQLDLPVLRSVGSLNLTGVDIVQIPLLNSIGDVSLSDNDFSTFAASSLSTITGHLVISGNPNVTTLDFMALTSVGTVLQIDSNENLIVSESSFPNLSAVVNGSAQDIYPQEGLMINATLSGYIQHID
jgi:hypothetical protein